jgi:hypothetical protein
MTTAIQERPNVIKKDADGNTYSIPQREVDAFIHASEAVQLAEFMSDEYDQARDELNNRFGEYRKDL